MNPALLALIRSSGYMSDAPLTAQQRYDLLTSSFWQKARDMGYNLTELRKRLWRVAGRPEAALIAAFPEAD